MERVPRWIFKKLTNPPIAVKKLGAHLFTPLLASLCKNLAVSSWGTPYEIGCPWLGLAGLKEFGCP